MSFAEFLTEDRRLVILRLLVEADGYDLNESILIDLLERLSHVVSRDRLRTDLAWLDEQDLITVERVMDVQVARVNKHGADVAKGKITVPGVKRPAPGD